MKCKVPLERQLCINHECLLNIFWEIIREPDVILIILMKFHYF